METKSNSPRITAAHARGMTLIEIMVVLAIITLILGGIGAVAFNRFAQAQVENAKNQTVQIQQLVEQYRIQKRGKCPQALGDLKTAGIASKISKDPWGNDYTIKCPGDQSSVDVSSSGPDGEAGTEDDIHNYDDEAGDVANEAKDKDKDKKS